MLWNICSLILNQSLTWPKWPLKNCANLIALWGFIHFEKGKKVPPADTQSKFYWDLGWVWWEMNAAYLHSKQTYGWNFTVYHNGRTWFQNLTPSNVGSEHLYEFMKLIWSNVTYHKMTIPSKKSQICLQVVILSHQLLSVDPQFWAARSAIFFRSETNHLPGPQHQPTFFTIISRFISQHTCLISQSHHPIAIYHSIYQIILHH